VVSGASPQIIDKGTFVVEEKTKPLYRPPNKTYQPILYDLDGPYRIIKKANNDTIMIIKNQDTLYFKYISIE
jgi:hypothetical protein